MAKSALLTIYSVEMAEKSFSGKAVYGALIVLKMFKIDSVTKTDPNQA